MSGKLRAVAQLFAASCFLLTGCSSSSRPTIAPVRGQVIYRGQPVADATVVFLCPGAPRLAVGKTDAQGNYQLMTYQPNDGAVIGNHVVTVKKYKEGPDQADKTVGNVGSMDRATLSKAIEKSMHTSAQAVAKAEKAGSVLPSKYANMKTSDLHKDVIEGHNVINIELSD